MKYSKEEIVKALYIIKNVCKEADCYKCPFALPSGVCQIWSNLPTPTRLEAED